MGRASCAHPSGAGAIASVTATTTATGGTLESRPGEYKQSEFLIMISLLINIKTDLHSVRYRPEKKPILRSSAIRRTARIGPLVPCRAMLKVVSSHTHEDRDEFPHRIKADGSGKPVEGHPGRLHGQCDGTMEISWLMPGIRPQAHAIPPPAVASSPPHQVEYFLPAGALLVLDSRDPSDQPLMDIQTRDVGFLSDRSDLGSEMFDGPVLSGGMGIACHRSVQGGSSFVAPCVSSRRAGRRELLRRKILSLRSG